jgi:hypothetical protein
MNDDTADVEQVDEDILTYTVSDEALEAAVGTERGLTPVTTLAVQRRLDPRQRGMLSRSA